MRDILLKHRAEVAGLIFKEFDDAEYIRLVEKDTKRQIEAFKEEIAQQKEQLFQQEIQLSETKKQLSQKDEQLSQKIQLFTQYKQMLQEHGLLDDDK